MNIAAELRNAVMDNFTIDKRLVSDAADAIEMLGEENAKLRELVRDMHKLLKLSAEIPAKVSHVHLTEQRMRELGIGVE